MSLTSELKKHASKEKAPFYQRFFKTGKGEYGEGDIFLGLTVPETRSIAKKFLGLTLPQIKKHISSKYHEERLGSLLILVEKFKKANEKERKEIFDFYLANTKHINNWDLVDLSAPKIVGAYLLDKPRKILYSLAKSNDLWEKRISVLGTFIFTRESDFDDCIAISEIHLKDKHDLMHKAVGWMLREIGKKDKEVLEKFLAKHSKEMPRTMLRYSIEKFPENERKKWLEK
ncbi:MAG: DNA alkylation repair protein [Candidatus Diapherotrites archaeon CG11_big_fil_rev_8_21_14_0_20_37_9]|nr:MAG: DNA alkylation repair protein [Candidatus Diapherotrites archaeon CG11_big_fil_rev_8_21_14_0_20_37_9]